MAPATTSPRAPRKRAKETTRAYLLRAVAAVPTVGADALAGEAGVSRQRVWQLLQAEGLTREPRWVSLTEGGANGNDRTEPAHDSHDTD